MAGRRRAGTDFGMSRGALVRGRQRQVGRSFWNGPRLGTCLTHHDGLQPSRGEVAGKAEWRSNPPRRLPSPPVWELNPPQASLIAFPTDFTGFSSRPETYRWGPKILGHVMRDRSMTRLDITQPRSTPQAFQEAMAIDRSTGLATKLGVTWYLILVLMVGALEGRQNSAYVLIVRRHRFC